MDLVYCFIIAFTRFTSAIADTKYVNGIHLRTLDIIKCPDTICKSHTIGVNQKNNCINILSNCEKSGNTVTIADVNLVKAIIKQYAANIEYININGFGIYPNTELTTIAIINKNNDTNDDATVEIKGITSTGNTTFLTK